jgi:hypothetical protein
MTWISRFGVLAVCIASAACSKADRARDSTSSRSLPSDAAHTEATSGLAVNEYGIGPIRAGMPVTQAFPDSRATATGCSYVQWADAPRGVRVMTENGQVARVDVDSGVVATTEGIRIGDTEEQVMQRYANRVAVTPSKYTNGHYLTVAPKIVADSLFRLVFETENDHVVRYRGGRRPAVDYVEGCG